MVSEVLCRRVVVAAGGFMVATADGRIERFSVFVDIESEAAFALACRAGVSTLQTCVFL